MWDVGYEITNPQSEIYNLKSLYSPTFVRKLRTSRDLSRRVSPGRKLSSSTGPT